MVEVHVSKLRNGLCSAELAERRPEPSAAECGEERVVVGRNSALAWEDEQAAARLHVARECRPLPAREALRPDEPDHVEYVEALGRERGLGDRRDVETRALPAQTEREGDEVGALATAFDEQDTARLGDVEREVARVVPIELVGLGAHFAREPAAPLRRGGEADCRRDVRFQIGRGLGDTLAFQIQARAVAFDRLGPVAHERRLHLGRLPRFDDSAEHARIRHGHVRVPPFADGQERQPDAFGRKDGRRVEKGRGLKIGDDQNFAVQVLRTVEKRERPTERFRCRPCPRFGFEFGDRIERRAGIAEHLARRPRRWNDE